MKTLLIIATTLLSLNLFAEEEYVCEGTRCSKKTVVVVPTQETELQLSELRADMCLMDIKKGTTVRLRDVDQKSGMITVLSEDDYILTRKVHFYSDNSLDRSMKIINCSETPTKVLSSNVDLKKCLDTAGKNSKDYFCAKPKVTKDFFNRNR